MTAKKNKHHRIKLWSIRFPVLNDIERIFKQLQICETFEPCDVVERLGHFDGIASSLACIPTKQHGVRGGKYLLNTPGDAISETLNFKMSLDASALKNVRLWCEFQSRLLFIISLLLKNFLTALNVMTSLLWPQFYGPIMVTLTEFHYVIKIYTWAKENWFLFFNSPQALGFNTLKLVLWKTLMSGKNWNCLSSCSNCWKGGL